MKRIVLICMFIALVSLAFAPPEIGQFEEVWISNEPTSDHTAGMYRVDDDYTFIDPNIGAHTLTELVTGGAQIVTVAKSGAQFTTIQAAINSITDSSAAKPYVVLIYPGVYEEKIYLSKSYISLIGVQPNGVKVTEAENGGVIITYESSGVGSDIYTLQVYNAEIQLKGITLANLTIINSQDLGVGPAQQALRMSGYGGGPKVSMINCNLYGEQDTIAVDAGFLNVQDCYINGHSDMVYISGSAMFFDCHFYVHQAGQEAFCINVGISSGALWIVNCLFDGIGTNHIANFNNDTDVLYFYGNYISEVYTTFAATNHFDYAGFTPTVYFSTHAGDFDATGDGTIKGGLNMGTATDAATGEVLASGDIRTSESVHAQTGLNVGTATGAAIGEGKFSGDVDALSFTIGANALTTAEWAFLDGQDQAVKIGDSPTFAGLTVGNVTMVGAATVDGRDISADLNQAVKTTDSPTFDDATMTGFVKTDGSTFFLAHDAIRHTISAPEAAAGNFTEVWDTATAAKVVSLDAAHLRPSTGNVHSQAKSDLGVSYYSNEPYIKVWEGAALVWNADDVITIEIVYEK